MARGTITLHCTHSKMYEKCEGNVKKMMRAFQTRDLIPMEMEATQTINKCEYDAKSDLKDKEKRRVG